MFLTCWFQYVVSDPTETTYETTLKPRLKPGC